MNESGAEISTTSEANPERSAARAKSIVEVVRDYTAIQGDGEPTFLVNVAAGNEPVIMGVKVAQEANNIRQEHGLPKARIVVPVGEGKEYDTRKRILLEEFPSDRELIHLDTEYGRILQQIIGSQGNFAEHLSVLKAHYDETERLINQRFSHDFETRSLTGETEIHSPSNVIGSFDTGGRLITPIVVNTPRRYFIFPVMLSELIAAAQREGLPFSESDVSCCTTYERYRGTVYSSIYS